jgi:geranylgeranylglycerol-phosphate geranylgeranyltransferase
LWLGGVLNGLSEGDPKLLVAAVSLALLVGGGNAINDVHDVRADKINRPYRPIASGRLTRRDGLAIAAVSMAISIIFGAAVSIGFVFYLVLLGILVVGYNSLTRRNGLLSNLVVSFLCSMAFILGGTVAGRVESSLLPAGFAFIYCMAREVAKGASDLEGDAVVGKPTLAVLFGKRRATDISIVLIVLVILLTPIPYFTGVMGPFYITMVMVLDLLLLFTIYLFRRVGRRDLVHLGCQVLKAGMPLGLMAFYLGS